jgi:hypothetical protein
VALWPLKNSRGKKVIFTSLLPFSPEANHKAKKELSDLPLKQVTESSLQKCPTYILRKEPEMARRI